MIIKKLYQYLSYKISKLPNDGMAIAIVTLIALMMTLSTMALYYLTSGFSKSTVTDSYKKQSDYLAESAADKALIILNERTGDSGHQDVVNTNDSISIQDVTDENFLKCLGLHGYTSNGDPYIYNVGWGGPSYMPDEDLADFSGYYIIQKLSEETDALVFDNSTTLELLGSFDNANSSGSRLFQSAFSIELNVHLDSISEGSLFQLYDDINSSREIVIGFNSDEEVIVNFYSGGSYVTFDSNITLHPTNPSHIIVTYSDASQNITIYVDGAGTQAYVTNGIDLAESNSLYTFEYVNTSGISGYTTMLRIWNRELGSDEVTGLINDYVFSSVTNPDLLTAFHFDENSNDRFQNKYDTSVDVCNNGDYCYFTVSDASEMLAKAVDNFTQSGTIEDPTESTIDPSTGEPYVNSLPSVISYSSTYKILSCGVGLNDIITGSERLVEYEGFASINQSIVGERRF